VCDGRRLAEDCRAASMGVYVTLEGRTRRATRLRSGIGCGGWATAGKEQQLLADISRELANEPR